MERIALNNRTYGDQFASFEKDLIFERKHSGWVEFIGTHRFRLRKSPFSKHYSSHQYFAPPDLNIKEGELVELDVGPLEHYGGSVDQYTREYVPKFQYHFVENYSNIQLKLKKPIETEEFIQRLTVNWQNADQDNLGEALALQILSCPPDVYGPGGIGSQSLNVSSKKKPLKDLKHTIAQVLPLDFTRKNKRYEFDFINSLQDADNLNHRRANRGIAEVSYNFLNIVDPSKISLPIQIPTIIQNSKFVRKSDDYFDSEVFDYILTALMLHPIIDDSTIIMVESNLRRIKEEIEPNYAGIHLPIDRYAITRLAMSMSRLEYKNQLDESAFDSGREWFTRLYREFLDLKTDIFQPGKTSYGTPNVRVSYAYASLDANDMKILRIIFRLCNERGQDWIHLSVIMEASMQDGLVSPDVLTSLVRLNESGMILQIQNGTMIKPIKMD